MPPEEISIHAAKKDKLFYFVANVVVYRESDGKCLILKRSMREKVHPGKYSLIGGKLEWKDLELPKGRVEGEVIDFDGAIRALLKREVREEAGIEIKSELAYLQDIVFIRPDGIPVVLIIFAAKYNSGEVIVEKDAFTDHAWVNAEEVGAYDIIENVKGNVQKAITIFRNWS